MKAQQLQREISGVDPEAAVVIAANGALLPVAGITYVPSRSVVVLRGESKQRGGQRFTAAEDGSIGRLGMMGFSDQVIGTVLGRTADSIERRRKKLGLP